MNIRLNLDLAFTDVQIKCAVKRGFLDHQSEIALINAVENANVESGVRIITTSLLEEMDPTTSGNDKINIILSYVRNYILEIIKPTELDAIVTWHPYYNIETKETMILYEVNPVMNAYFVHIAVSEEFPEISVEDLKDRIVYSDTHCDFEEDTDSLRNIIDEYLDSLNLDQKPNMDIMVTGNTIFIVLTNLSDLPNTIDDDYLESD